MLRECCQTEKIMQFEIYYILPGSLCLISLSPFEYTLGCPLNFFFSNLLLRQGAKVSSTDLIRVF